MDISMQLGKLILASQKILKQINEGDWPEVNLAAERRNMDCKKLFQSINHKELSQFPDLLRDLAELDQQILNAIGNLKTDAEQLLSQSRRNKAANIAYLSHSA